MCKEVHGTYSNCPVCSEDVNEVCLDCLGSKVYWFDEDGNETQTKQPNSVDCDTCRTCEGEGVVPCTE
jgi:hypothetical protein